VDVDFGVTHPPPSDRVPPVGFKAQLYDRQRRLVLWQQEIIEKAHVLIVGMGGLGCEIAKNLTLAGVGKITIVDCDTIEVSNLSRQMLYREADVGKPKVHAAKKALTNLSALVNITAYYDKIENLSSRIIQEADVVVGALDLWEPRRYLNAECIRHNKVFVDGGLEGYLGRVLYIHPGKTPCLICYNPTTPSETTVTEPCTLIGVPRKREHCVWKALYQYFQKHQKSPDESDYIAVTEIHVLANKYAEEFEFKPFTDIEVRTLLWNKIPSIITLNAIIGGIQSQQALVYLHLVSENLNEKNTSTRDQLVASHRIGVPSLTIYDGLTNRFVVDKLIPDPQCPICGIEKKDALTISIKQNDTIHVLIQKVQKAVSGLKGEFAVFRYDKILFDGEKISELNLRSGDTVILQSLNNDEEELNIKLEVVN
jgi:ubiquitin-activating enzyme E1 C